MNLAQERQIKHERVAEYLAAAGLDGVLLTGRANFSWYTCGCQNHVTTGCEIGSSSLLVTKETAVVIANNIESTRLAGEDLLGTGIELVSYDWHDSSAWAIAIAKLAGGMKLASDVPLAGIDATNLGEDFSRLRWALTESEIDRYRAVCDDTTAAVEAAARKAQPSMTENQLVGMVSQELMNRDLTVWLLLAGSDERALQFRHPLPTSKPMEKFVMVAACADRGGLIASISRLVSFSKATSELVQKQAATADVAAALVGSTRPGVTLGQMFAEGVSAYESTGWSDQWKLHHQGGSCGYGARDVKAAPGDTTAAVAGQGFAWNPSIAGAKVEQMVLCSSSGPPELLTQPTDWPTVSGQWAGYSLDCPAILEL